MLLIRFQTACLASSSTPLRVYDLSSNERFHLASYGAPTSVRVGINHLSHDTGPVFCVLSPDNPSMASLIPKDVLSRWLQTLLRSRIPHAFIPFALRATRWHFASPALLRPSSLMLLPALLREQSDRQELPIAFPRSLCWLKG